MIGEIYPERLADWWDEEQVGAEHEEVRCELTCEALEALVNRYMD